MTIRWTKVPLGDVITLQRGFDLPERKRVPGSVPVYGSFGITGYHDTARAPGPGVLIGRSGASFGVVNYAPTAFWPHNAVLWVTDFKGNDPRFVSYLLKSMDFSNLNSGSAQPSLNRNYLYPLPVRCPDLDIQCRIASILSAYDDLIDNNSRRIRILEEMAQMIYREWFVNFRFPGHEKVKMVESEIGTVPSGWPVQKVNRAVEVDPTTKVPKEGMKPFVPMGSLSHTSMLIADVEQREGNSGSKFKNGDTLFARITPCLENGKTGFVQFLPNSEAVAFGSTEFIVLRSRTVNSEYVYLMARSEEFRDNAIKSMSGATGRQRVQEQCFDRFLIAHPPLDMLEEFQGAVKPMFRLVYALSLKNRNLRTTRDLLVPKLISGEVNVKQVEAEAVAHGV